jgi:hypothetical protein
MLTTADVRTFLDAEGISQLAEDSEFPDMPDRVAVVRVTGGAGESYEGLFVRFTLQVLSRGEQNDAVSAETLAHAIDEAFMSAERPQIGGYVTSIRYVGGPPAYVGRDEAQRTVMSCNYLLEAER